MGLDVEGGGAAETHDRDSKHGITEGESVLDLSNAEEGVSRKEVGAAAGSDNNEEQLADAA